MTSSFPRLDFRISKQALLLQIEKNWCLASYLIINFDIGDLVTLAERELPQNFSKQMAEYVYGYIYEKKMPPDEIAQTVLNVSEDMMAGRQVQLRAGDYIAVQKYMHQTKMK